MKTPLPPQTNRQICTMNPFMRQLSLRALVLQLVFNNLLQFRPTVLSNNNNLMLWLFLKTPLSFLLITPVATTKTKENPELINTYSSSLFECSERDGTNHSWTNIRRSSTTGSPKASERKSSSISQRRSVILPRISTISTKQCSSNSSFRNPIW